MSSYSSTTTGKEQIVKVNFPPVKVGKFLITGKGTYLVKKNEIFKLK